MLLLLFCSVHKVLLLCIILCMHCTCVVVRMLYNNVHVTMSCALYRDLFCKWLSCVNLKVSVLICYCSRHSITIQVPPANSLGMMLVLLFGSM